VQGRSVRVALIQASRRRPSEAYLEFAPGKPFSRDNYRSLQAASVCKGDFPAVFGLTPTALEQVVPTYIQRSA
jgi:NADH dehydrogenase